MNKYLKYYGIIYIIVLIMIVGFGTVYLNDLNSITLKKFNPPVYNSDTAKKQTDLPFVKSSITAPVDVAKFGTSTPELIEKGKSIFQTQCASCHGVEGKGDGVAGLSLNPRPRNFHSLEGWTNGTKFSEMYRTLHEGITSRGMASYSNIIPEERFAILHYVRTFANYPAITPDDLNEIDLSYSLSKGIKTSGQIPIIKSEQIILEENLLKKNKINSTIENIKNSKGVKGADIFVRYCNNYEYALNSLFNYKDWNKSEINFINFITKDPEQKGFKSSITTMNGNDWTELFNFLKSQINFSL